MCILHSILIRLIIMIIIVFIMIIICNSIIILD